MSEKVKNRANFRIIERKSEESSEFQDYRAKRPKIERISGLLSEKVKNRANFRIIERKSQKSSEPRDYRAKKPKIVRTHK
ncbi:hypothetical protein D5F11_001425 [Siminovitchia terrae]|uniref:Uncharacterized protein n=1 Tax=Siminovitchia terrae TaxID=1914933 RepID=A0A429XDN3_SIMTE|nr:hypothetical protein [Siminovitchia terrae]RST61564.1 hypothetical protein D5F11_001425 [Siminovitchia terrae]